MFALNFARLLLSFSPRRRTPNKLLPHKECFPIIMYSSHGSRINLALPARCIHKAHRSISKYYPAPEFDKLVVKLIKCENTGLTRLMRNCRDEINANLPKDLLVPFLSLEETGEPQPLPRWSNLFISSISFGRRRLLLPRLMHGLQWLHRYAISFHFVY